MNHQVLSISLLCINCKNVDALSRVHLLFNENEKGHDSLPSVKAQYMFWLHILALYVMLIVGILTNLKMRRG